MPLVSAGLACAPTIAALSERLRSAPGRGSQARCDILVLLVLSLLLGVGCSLPPASLPLTRAAALGGTSFGATLTASRASRRPGIVDPDADAERSSKGRCANLTFAANGLEPAIADRCIFDAQVQGHSRVGPFSFGAVGFGGATTDMGLGVFAGVHLLDADSHRLLVGTGLGPGWVLASLGYALRPFGPLWLYLAPEYGREVGGLSVWRGTLGTAIEITDWLALVAEAGIAAQATDRG